MTEYSNFAPQVRFIDLLDDKTFKHFFRAKATLPHHLRKGKREPWRVYAQIDENGRWAKKDFATYAEAANFAIHLVRKGCWDLALHCRSVGFKPPGRWVNLTKNGKPVWLKDKDTGKPIKRDGKKVQKQKFVVIKMPAGHEWCPYCRRPTVFRWFTSHHAFPKKPEVAYDSAHLRCTICGIRESSIKWRGGSK